MNELDRFIKHELKVKYYLRYTDDFVIVHHDANYLERLIPKIDYFLQDKLKLYLHPNKVILRKLSWGADFLGYIILPHHRLLRTKTKRRIFKKVDNKIRNLRQDIINRKSFEQTMQSYFGLLRHCHSKKTKGELKNSLRS